MKRHSASVIAGDAHVIPTVRCRLALSRTVTGKTTTTTATTQRERGRGGGTGRGAAAAEDGVAVPRSVKNGVPTEWQGSRRAIATPVSAHVNTVHRGQRGRQSSVHRRKDGATGRGPSTRGNVTRPYKGRAGALTYDTTGLNLRTQRSQPTAKGHSG